MGDYPNINKIVNENGKRRPQHKEWEWIRAEMIYLKSELQLSDTEFRPLSPYDDWRGIEKKILPIFFKLAYKRHFMWYWKYIKTVKFTVYSLSDKCRLEALSQLIGPNERIWLVMMDEGNKPWFYEGIYSAVHQLLGSLVRSEYYLVSKKYQWLICVNYSDDLIVTGGDMPQKLKHLEESVNSIFTENKAWE